MLISGCADYGMLAIVNGVLKNAAALQNAETKPLITVTDVCETPLLLCRWYAERYGISVETQAADILEYAAPELFDVVCTHFFFPQLHPSRWSDLVVNWHRLLRLGGAIFTTMRFGGASTEDETGITDAQVKSFCDLVSGEAARRTDLAKTVATILPGDLIAQADRFARRTRFRVFRDEAEIIDLFESNGFTFARLDKTTKPGAVRTHTTLEGGNRDVTYAEIVAIKK